MHRTVTLQIQQASLNERILNSFGDVLRDNPSSTTSNFDHREVGRAIVNCNGTNNNNSNNNPIPSCLNDTVIGGGGVLSKVQQGLFGFSSSLKQVHGGLGPGLSQISGSNYLTKEPNKWSSSIPCNSATGQIVGGVIGELGLVQTNEEVGLLLPGRPASGTINLARGPLLPSSKPFKGKCKLTSTTMTTEEDSLSEAVGEVYRGQGSRRQSEHHPHQSTAFTRGALRNNSSHLIMPADSLLSSAGNEVQRHQNGQPIKYLSQGTVPVLGATINTPSGFDMPEDSLSLAAGVACRGRNSNLPEHIPRGSKNVGAIGFSSSTNAAYLGKSIDSLPLATGEMYI